MSRDVELHDLITCFSCGVILDYSTVKRTDKSVDNFLHCPCCKNILKDHL